MRAHVTLSLLRTSLATSLAFGTSACEKSGTPDPVQAPQAASSAQTSTRDQWKQVSRRPGTNPRAAHVPDNSTPSTRDRGPFPQYNDKLSLRCPRWLEDASGVLVRPPSGGPFLLVISGFPACLMSENAYKKPIIELNSLETNDMDQDGIVDQIDVLRGAKKTVLNGAAYRAGYHALDFPGGDVPQELGVCTDVIIRALRNAGVDLQAELSRDIKARPAAYPMVKQPDTNIDHRRVRTLLPFFEKHYSALSTNFDDRAAPFLPGDILFMNTIGDSTPEHMGIVSDQVGASGAPLIINNWTDGTKTAEMDLLTRVPVTHRFRIGQQLVVPASAQGLGAFIERQQLQLPEESRQAVSVVAPLWSSPGAMLQRWQRDGQGKPWRALEAPMPVRLGRAGLGPGRGFSQVSGTVPPKKEGDKRSPAGVFRFGTAFGQAQRAPYEGGYAYRPVRSGDYWVDDAQSPLYNTWQQLPAGTPAPWSAEDLTMYRLGLVVQHNTEKTLPGAGSAIFLHPWGSPEKSTVGCTAMPTSQLLTLLGWLDEKHAPVLVQSAGHIFQSSPRSRR